MAEVDGFSTVGEMLAALRGRRVSAVELLELHRARIARHNRALNAIVVENPEAEASAREADARRARGDDAALLGLPIVLKDCIYWRGLPTTGGLVERRAAVAEDDAPAAARLRAAGAVLLGKTNVPPYAADWQSDNPVFGRTNNPWDLGRTPGGSTGGGAAALAAGLGALEHGGDFGGSIRIPAAFCGVYGHRPSDTLLPRGGHFPGGLTPGQGVSMAVQGPLARGADDLELALGVTAGADPTDEETPSVELPPARHARLRDFRVAVLPPIPWQPVEDSIVAALHGLAERLGRAGATVREAQPEGFGDLRRYQVLYRSLFAALTFSGMPPAARHAEGERIRAAGGDDLDLAWADGAEAGVGEYLGWLGERARYRASLRRFFRDWDVLLAPAAPVNAFPHDARPFRERRLTVDGRERPYNDLFTYAPLCNLSGHPGTAFPAGSTAAGLPIGLQAVGPYLEDRTPIRFARQVAEELGLGYRRPPAFAQP